jgi:hypothetical protein
LAVRVSDGSLVGVVSTRSSYASFAESTKVNAGFEDAALPRRSFSGIVLSTLKRPSDYLQFRPYRAIVAPPLKRAKFQAPDGNSGLLDFAVGSAPPLRSRNRFLYAIFAVAVMSIGLLWRSDFLSMPPDLTKYGGSVWWSFLVFLGCGWVSPHARTWVVALFALGFSTGVELSQLYHAPWIDHLRSFPLGALMLGSTFNWADLLAYASGILAGAMLENLARRWNTGRDPRRA